MREDFARQLEKTGYLHTLLELDSTRSAEKRLLAKRVTAHRKLSPAAGTGWRCTGEGQIAPDGGAWQITVPARVEPAQPMEHYTTYNYFYATLPLAREDWRGFNRVVCRVRPECNGLHAPHLSLCLRNEGLQPIPDTYNREGKHVLNLQNHQWNDCVWEFADLPRDAVTELSFMVGSYGRELWGGDALRFLVEGLALEQAEPPDVSLGWQMADGTVGYSTSGYWAKGKKTAVTSHAEGPFQLLAESGEVVFNGMLTPLENHKGRFGIADFSAVTAEGRYSLRVGETLSGDFSISALPMEEAAWKVLNFVYAERCGYPVGRGHSHCHGDLIATHAGKRILYSGGWHDAGDLSQQTLQTGEVALALFQLAQRVKGQDTLLYNRLVEEACWGLDFVLRTRFGDGYRAFSVGCRRWTNGFIGDSDDEPVRCHNRSFDNWLLAGVQAYASQCLAEEDPELAWVCLDTAKQDFAFAKGRFEEVGMEHCVQMEHTYNASLSQYQAVAAWAAAQLYSATGEERYLHEACEYGILLLRCQATEADGAPFTGFFYRDEGKRHIVHFNHQAREHLFAETLAILCATKPQQPCWRQALQSYTGYLKALYDHAAPYGMLPAGLHHESETEDAETFPLLHVNADYATDRENYRAQLATGTQLGGGYCLRQFPVWFSFRGNTAVQLSMAKAAAAAGQALGDEVLLEIGREQLYWVAGKNPFGQSLMYGEGHNYAQQYAALCGEVMGEVPVGIQTRENEDVPYWPMANNATYKEVWMSTAGHWLRLLAELY